MSRFRIVVPALCLLFLAGPTVAQVPSISGPGYKALGAYLTAAVANGDVPGIVVLVTGPDGVIYHQGFGKLDVAGNVPMRRDAIFRIASMTKALTSTAVMMLVEEGKVGLDDPIGKYLPALANPQVLSRVDLAAGKYETRPATRPITIRQLLTHTSGIGYSWSDPGLALVEKKTGETSETALPLVHEPGERWTYGASTKVLGDLIEKVSGEPVAAFMRRRVFTPLGMQDTGWSVPASERSRVATSHRKVNGTLTETPNPAELVVEPRGDGRLFSTAADYARFMRMILNRGYAGSSRLLRAETVDAMSRPQTGDVKVRLQPVVLTDLAKPFPKGAGRGRLGPRVPVGGSGQAGSRPSSSRQHELGWHQQHLLLDRPPIENRRRCPDAGAAVLRRGGAARAGRGRDAGVPGPEVDDKSVVLTYDRALRGDGRPD